MKGDQVFQFVIEGLLYTVTVRDNKVMSVSEQLAKGGNVLHAYCDPNVKEGVCYADAFMDACVLAMRDYTERLDNLKPTTRKLLLGDIPSSIIKALDEGYEKQRRVLIS